MFVENIELTMSHVGLGTLNEYALMVLFGNAHSRHLVAGRDIKPDEIRDRDGTVLYPAYFATHLKVPMDSLLHQYKLWQTVAVGVDVNRFGDTLLQSHYILGRPGEIPAQTSAWEHSGLPTMVGNNLLVADGSNSGAGSPQALRPDPSYIAELEKSRVLPSGIQQSKRVRHNGFPIEKSSGIYFESTEPIEYSIQIQRDAAPGHSVMFAKFPEIMNYAEYHYLTTRLACPLPHEALHGLYLVERETYYYGNCFADESLSVRVAGTIEPQDEPIVEEGCDFIASGYLTVVCEVYQKRDHTLLALSRARKIIGVDLPKQDLAGDVHRTFVQLSARNVQ